MSRRRRTRAAMPTQPAIQTVTTHAPSGKAVCNLVFSARCPTCRTLVDYEPRFDREHDLLKQYVHSYFSARKKGGEVTRTTPGRLHVPTACPGCGAEFIIDTITV